MFLDRVLDRSEILNETDHILIKYIEKNKDRIRDLTIREVSEDNFVAYNTVVRFSKKLGYSGFSELKFSFKEPVLDVAEPCFDLLSTNNHMTSVINTSKILSEIDLEKIALKLFLSDQVYIFGVGDSNYYSTVLFKRLLKGEKKSIVLENLYEVDNVIKLGNKKSMIIFISAGGNTEEICIRARRTISQGISVVSFTGNSENELSTITSDNILFDYELEIIESHNVSDLSGLLHAITIFSETYSKLTNKSHV